MDNPKIVIADDHPLFLAALRDKIQQIFPGASIREAATMEAVIGEVSKAPHDVDLVLLDLNMPGSVGFTGLLLLKARFPTVPIAIVSASQAPATIRQAIGLGASGYIPKILGVETIKEAINRILAGDLWVPEGVSLTPPSGGEEEMDVARRFASLSPQELRVLDRIRIDMLNKQIAHELGIHLQTVKDHVTCMLAKLKVRRRTGAALLAERYLNNRE